MAYEHTKSWKKRNPEKRNAQRRKNYKSTAAGNIREGSKWIQEEDRLLINFDMSDRYLHSIIGRSVQAIQLRRHKLKHKLAEAAGLKEPEEWQI